LTSADHLISFEKKLFQKFIHKVKKFAGLSDGVVYFNYFALRRHKKSFDKMVLIPNASERQFLLCRVRLPPD